MANSLVERWRQMTDKVPAVLATTTAEIAPVWEATADFQSADQARTLVAGGMQLLTSIYGPLSPEGPAGSDLMLTPSDFPPPRVIIVKSATKGNPFSSYRIALEPPEPLPYLLKQVEQSLSPSTQSDWTKIFLPFLRKSQHPRVKELMNTTVTQIVALGRENDAQKALLVVTAANLMKRYISNVVADKGATQMTRFSQVFLEVPEKLKGKYQKADLIQIGTIDIPALYFPS